MENKSVISCEELIKYMNEKTKSAVTIKSCGQDIDVTTTLSITAFNECVNRIVEMLYDENGSYIPNLKDFFIRVVILFAYTNVQFPSDFEEMMDEIYNLVYRTSFYNDVIKVINKDQYDALLAAIDTEVEYINNNNINRINQQISNLASGLETLGSQFTNMFGDVSEEDVNKLISAIENNAIDEKKLMEAYKSGGEE